MKACAPTLKKVTGNWHVSITMPTEPRDQLGSQIRRSTGSSDKKEAKKISTRIVLKTQAQISAAKKALELLEIRANVSKSAKELGRYDDFDFHNADHFNLKEVAIELSRTSDREEREFGAFNINALQKQL